jgi:hypothetical protein
MTDFTLALYGAKQGMLDATKQRFDAAILRYDAWFLVVIAVLLTLGAIITAGMAVWCVVNQKGRFTGRWTLKNWGLSASFECV